MDSSVGSHWQQRVSSICHQSLYSLKAALLGERQKIDIDYLRPRAESVTNRLVACFCAEDHSEQYLDRVIHYSRIKIASENLLSFFSYDEIASGTYSVPTLHKESSESRAERLCHRRRGGKADDYIHGAPPALTILIERSPHDEEISSSNLSAPWFRIAVPLECFAEASRWRGVAGEKWGTPTKAADKQQRAVTWNIRRRHFRSLRAPASTTSTALL